VLEKVFTEYLFDIGHPLENSDSIIGMCAVPKIQKALLVLAKFNKCPRQLHKPDRGIIGTNNLPVQ